ncbi:hypothetical protein ACI3KS_00075 [Microbacterium sp. ZW T5_45]|uniref:hypothetical protein n=1 Tax=Microbacterium sp. ZW T5_45 TaxID=3378080 RepID=UPI0038534DC5
MRASDVEQLAGRIHAAVSAVAGVERIYGAGGLASTVVRAGAAALGVDAGSPVRVADGESGTRVDVSLGVDGSLSAADVLQAVRAAIDGVLASEGLVTERVTLTIAHVHPREGADRS